MKKEEITLKRLSDRLRSQVENSVLDRSAYENLLRNYVMMALDIADQAIKERDEITLQFTGMDFDRYKKS